MAAVLLALTSCSKDNLDHPALPTRGISFSLKGSAFENCSRAHEAADDSGYDRVEIAVAGSDGKIVDNIKSGYDRVSSTLHIEGLREGEYRLLVLGIKGDSGSDGVRINDMSDISDVWLDFGDSTFPLAAEYFYSSTAFSVEKTSTPEGDQMVPDIQEEIVQKRIVSRMDFDFMISNPYVESAVLSRKVVLESPVFHTQLTGDGEFAGESAGDDILLDISESGSWLFMPASGGSTVHGSAELRTRDVRGGEFVRAYSFSGITLAPNRISPVEIEAVHPDDRSGMLFVSETHYEKGNHGLILQDDEHHSVYADKSQRSFNTSAPLQVWADADGLLHVRFYSPRELSRVLVKAKIPGAGDEYLELAYFDRIPAFADFSEIMPLAGRSVFLRSESGKIVELPKAGAETFAGMTFKTESDDPYKAKLDAIKHGWNIHFSLYGGDPEREDGGPSGNWMGIRPVHCREAVALFLNFTYMIDMPEHEQILRDNQDKLYGNGGVNDKVSVETVLAQMRQARTVQVGLVYTGHNVYGLGGGIVFGAYQAGWLRHYTSTYACEVMFHELGHVMGYTHASAFTYGPWAQELMNNFYVNHLSEMPVDSPTYLNSLQNPNLYPGEPKAAMENAREMHIL